MAERAISAVVFDVGGVLLEWDPRHVYRDVFEDEAEMERFLAEVCSREWHEDNDRGVRYAESCAALAARFPQYAREIHLWGERTEDMIVGTIDGTVEVLGELQAAGVPCYGLTNMEAETYPVRYERYEFLRSLEGTVVSSQEGVIKPDPEIFRRLFARFGLAPEQTVFVDDVERNIAAARALGMKTVLFTSPAQLRGELVALGLPLATEG
ncbi:MAG TPA: HAD family phosphatase [Solirubrobacteraceae bacterium]